MLDFLKNFLRYWHTLRYLKLIQITSRLKLILPKSKVSLDKKNDLNNFTGFWIESAQRIQKMESENTFKFLNESHKLETNSWDDIKASKLWLYNLHYFDDLNAHDSITRKSWHYELLNKWIKENPPFEGTGWDSYPTSLRIVNWIKWALNGNLLKTDVIYSLEIQCRFLEKNIEKQLLGNHLFANGKALTFAGFFFDGVEAKKWRKIGTSILKKQVEEQVLSDGGNFELSPMYHIIFLEDLLDLINLYRTFDLKPPVEFVEKVPLMLSWLKTMCHPDGKISFFNDSAFGITPSVREIEDYANRLDLFEPINNNRNNYFKNLSASGFTRVVYGEIVAIIDRSSIGPSYLPAHAHADTLSFELSIFGKRVIVNSGTSVYGSSEKRQLQRGTQSHSTVMIDNQNSSEVWGGFRVARRAKVFNSIDFQQDDIIVLSASHNGYHRLKGKPTHTRKWKFSSQLVVIEDLIEGNFNHDVELAFFLHPDININQISESKVELKLLDKTIKLNFEGKGFMVIENSKYHPEFGVSNDNFKILFRIKGNLPVKVKTRISW